MTINKDLRDFAAIVRDYGDSDSYSDMAIRAADALDAQEARIKALEGALRGGADLIDGDLVGPEWRAACRKFTTEARALLGEK